MIDNRSVVAHTQVTLKAIPPRTGRVSDWLGPFYFNEEMEVTRGSPVRLLKKTDHSSFRNNFKNSSLGNFNKK